MSEALASPDLIEGIQLIIFDQYKTLTEGNSDPEREIIKEFNLAQDYAQVEAIVCGTRWDEDTASAASIHFPCMPATP